MIDPQRFSPRSGSCRYPFFNAFRDIPRCKTGEVGVSLGRQTLSSGTLYESYRAIWPRPGGGYEKRSFSLKKYGKRSAFRLAVQARRQGLALLESALRTTLDLEIARRSAKR